MKIYFSTRDKARAAAKASKAKGNNVQCSDAGSNAETGKRYAVELLAVAKKVSSS